MDAEAVKRLKLDPDFPGEKEGLKVFEDIPAKVVAGGSLCTATVRLNAYGLELPKKGEPGYREHVFKYRITVLANYKPRKCDIEEGSAEEPKGRSKDLHRGLKGDVPTSERHNVCFNVIEQLATKVWGVGGMEFVYDRSQILYSSKKIVEELQSREDTMVVEENDRLKSLSTTFIGHPISYTITTELVELVELSASSNAESTTQFLDVLTSMRAYRNISEALATGKEPPVSVCRSEIFFPAKSKPFNNDPRILMRGKSSPFFPEGPVAAFLAKLLGRQQFGGGGRRDFSHSRGSRDSSRGRDYGRDQSRDSRDFSRDRRHDSDGQNDAEELAKILYERGKTDLAGAHLKNVIVVTTHLEKNRMFPVHGLTNDVVGHITFTDRDNQKLSIAEYFEQKYKMRVNRNLPAAIHLDKSRKEPRECYYPLEVLKIVKNQRVSVQKTQMEPNMVSPFNLVASFEDAKKELQLMNSNIYLKHFGKLIETNKAVSLNAPEILYERNVATHVDGMNLNWRADNTVFRLSADVHSLRWCVVDVQNACGRDLDNFIEAFTRRAKEFKLNLPPPKQQHAPQMRGNRFDDFDKCMQELQRKDINFVIFLTRSKTDDSHVMMKTLETKYGICTQQILSRNASMAKRDTLSNIIMKTNLKLGGSNYLPSLERSLSRTLGGMCTIKECMFIAVAHSGPGPATMLQKETNEVCGPRAAAMAYTMDSELRMNGSWWFYDADTKNPNKMELGGGDVAKETVCEEAVKRYITALEKYHSFNGSWPKMIYVYRAGTSEGEFSKIRKTDVADFKQALHRLNQSHLNHVFLVAVRGSKNRLFKPADDTREFDKPPQQNVRAGTGIIRELTHPRLTEFVLQSHRSIQGTGRPVRYVVLEDTCTPRARPEELFAITFTMAFGHGIVTSPVSVPAPLYAAADLAERAQRMAKFNSGQLGDVDSLNEKLQNVLDHRFWA